jgi:glycogen operon protein
MLSGGDEIGRTQQGNNNAYCQDNEISWYEWQNVNQNLLEFCRRLIRYRKDHPVFRRRGWFHGRPIHGGETNDIAWFTMEGEQMAEENWEHGYAKSLGIFLNGATIPNPNPRGEPVIDDNFYIIFNAHNEPLNFTLPDNRWGEHWLKELDTETGFTENEESFRAGDQLMIEGRSLVVLRHAS